VNYLVSILKEMNRAATGGNERRSEMSIHNRPQEGLGPGSKRDEGRFEEDGDAAPHAAPEKATHKDAGAEPPKEQPIEDVDAVDTAASLGASFELDLQTGKNEKFLSGRIDSADIITCGFGLSYSGKYQKSFYGSVNKEELKKALERLENTPLPPKRNTLADQMRRGKRRR
jgi:hypothetical protein